MSCSPIFSKLNYRNFTDVGGGVGGRLNTTFGIVEDEAEAAAAGAPNTTYTRLLDATFDQKMRLDTTFDLDHQQV